jgi:hypothetical protein
MRMLFFICESFTKLETFESLLASCEFGQYTINEKDVLSINYDDAEGGSIEYIGIEPEERSDVIDECGEDSEIYKEFYCNEYFSEPSVFWVRYSVSTSDRYLLTSVLKCFKDGGLYFLVNNGRHGNFQVDEFIKHVTTLI